MIKDSDILSYFLRKVYPFIKVPTLIMLILELSQLVPNSYMSFESTFAMRVELNCLDNLI
jgi:hypothetical protein